MTPTSATSSQPLPFIDLAAQRARLGRRLEAAIARVLAHGQYILGPEVDALEAELAAFCGAREAVACANGTDALALVLMAQELRPGQAVLCPSFTFAATAEVIAWFGATPVFIDVDGESFNADPASLTQGIASARQHGLDPVGVIAVDLFGQPADYDALEAICAGHRMWLLADAAQSFGAVYKGRRVGALAFATCTSFFPSKPLGCYGDGGAIFTDDPALAATLRSLRMHGEGADRYDHVRIGMNSRLDSLQAAILREKLRIFPEECERRNLIAARYSAALAEVAAIPRLRPGSGSVWAQYTIRVDAEKRDRLASDLHAEGIPTATHYRVPLHRQPAYRSFPRAGNGLPVSETLAQEVISLPMHPYLDAPVQDRIIAAVHRSLRTPIPGGLLRPPPEPHGEERSPSREPHPENTS